MTEGGDQRAHTPDRSHAEVPEEKKNKNNASITATRVFYSWVTLDFKGEENCDCFFLRICFLFELV